MAFSWDLDTRPFADANGTQPARFSLRQVDDDTFELSESFLYTGGPHAGPVPVTAEHLGRTDLASIPSFLGWFARRSGRHTPAALLHDQLITDEPERLPEDQRLSPSSPTACSATCSSNATCRSCAPTSCGPASRCGPGGARTG